MFKLWLSYFRGVSSDSSCLNFPFCKMEVKACCIAEN